MTGPVRIAMWSGPRNISTAMMRSFGARADCAVSDEPFYGAFLKETGEPHPMAAETIADMDCDWNSVIATQSGAIPGGKSVWYQKHMPHHMVGPVGIGDFPRHRHAFLIRAPERVVASYAAKNELRRPELLGFAQLRDYFEVEAERAPGPGGQPGLPRLPHRGERSGGTATRKQPRRNRAVRHVPVC